MGYLCHDHIKNTDVNFHDYFSDNLYTWCTNCGNYGITAATKRALVKNNIKPQDVLLCFDIGCNGNGGDKIGGYRVHGLHGRVLPFATGAALANHNVKVVASAGDGATMSEGINHFIHCIRSNYNITFILHNNCNYGLTKGQASATTRKDVPMNSSPDGVTADTINVLHLALSMGVSFAARSFSGNVPQMSELIAAGINHPGFAIIEILQNCPTYNKATPHEWYQERVYDLINTDHNTGDINEALRLADDLDEKIATGILYQNPTSIPFEQRLVNRQDYTSQLVEEVKNYDSQDLLEKFK